MTPTVHTNQEPPIADPVVTIAGRAYTVIYSLRAEFKCSEWGQDPREMMRILYDVRAEKQEDGTMKMIPSQNPKHLFYVLALFSACVAHNFVGEVAPTPDQWAATFGEDADLVGVCARALYAALGKRLRERMQRLPRPAAAIPEASTTALQ